MKFWMKTRKRNKRTEDLFFAALRSALWAGTPLPAGTSAEWEAVCVEAHRQAVIGLVTEALLNHKVKMGRKASMAAFSSYVKIQRTNAYIDRELLDFTERIASLGIRFVVVKGQVAARAYPDPSVRQPGDIDLYLDADNYRKAVRLLPAELGIRFLETTEARESGLHTNFFRNDVNYEVHYHLARFYYPPHDRFFEALLSEGFRTPVTEDVQGKPVPTLPPALHTLYLFVHIFGHYLREGIGLRQLCDLVLWLYRYKDDEAFRQTLLDSLHGIGLTRAFSAFGWVMVERLGLPEEVLPLPLTAADRRRGQRIERDLLAAGNFGIHQTRRVHGAGLAHSLESGWILLRKAVLNFPIAPMEFLCIFPRVGWEHVRDFCRSVVNIFRPSHGGDF